MMAAFGEWIAQSGLSLFLGEQGWWLVPTLQTVHILAIAALFSSMLMLSARMLDIGSLRLTVPQAFDLYLPWILGAVPILAASGIILIVTEPVRSLDNQAFWLKMLLLVIAVAVTLRFRSATRDRPDYWTDRTNRGAILAYVGSSIVLWCAIIFAGRWIAYVNS